MSICNYVKQFKPQKSVINKLKKKPEKEEQYEGTKHNDT